MSKLSLNDEMSANITPRAGLKHSRFHYYCHQHMVAFRATWQRLNQQKFSTLMTLLVIAIALALPSGLMLVLQNVKHLSSTWDNTTQISLYLNLDTPAPKVHALTQRINAMVDVASVRYISPEAGLAAFEKTSGLTGALKALAKNPLPGVLIVQPQLGQRSAEQLQILEQRLAHLPDVNQVQLDMAWIQRLQALLSLGDRSLFALSVLFGVGVLLIIGNTIHLVMQRFHDEIDIVKLVGATDAFVRRPFLYCGILYGLSGGLLAWGLVACCFWWLKKPIQQLALSYASHYQLAGFTVSNCLLLLLSASILGWLGARLAVRRYLTTHVR